MKKVVQLSSGQRHELFQETAARKKIKPAIAEKDFWVCWTLERLFEEASISRSFLFKGGTSLSKVFGLIDRFSEDIDLILDWRLFSEEAPEAERSKTQQDKFNLIYEIRGLKRGRGRVRLKPYCPILSGGCHSGETGPGHVDKFFKWD